MSELNGDHLVKSALVGDSKTCSCCDEPIDPSKPFWARIVYPNFFVYCTDCAGRCSTCDCNEREDDVDDVVAYWRANGEEPPRNEGMD